MGPVFPASLLVDLPHWVGDQLMAVPAIGRLLTANRRGRSVLVTVPGMRRLLEHIFPEAEIFVSARRVSPFRSARELCRGRERFELGVTLRNATRAKIALRLSSRVAWGSAGQGSRLLLDHHFDVNRSLHQVHDADAMLAALGLDPVTGTGYGFTLDAGLVEEGRRVVVDAGLGAACLVGLAPTTALGSAKRWPNEYFGALARRLRSAGLEPVVLLGPGEQHFGHAISHAAGEPLRVFGADLDVAGLAGLISQLQLVVSVDSGPMHLAAASGLPVLALFGPTQEQRTAPLGDTHRVLSRALDCLGCGAQRCSLHHHRCMVELSVEEVEREAMSLYRTLAQTRDCDLDQRVGAL